MIEQQAKVDKILDGVGVWTSYYRSNIHRFAKDYLGINLKIFQQIILCEMNEKTNSMMVCCRGIGKSWLTALFCVIRCILYPNSVITCAAKTRKQGGIIISKIKDSFMPDSPNLRNEIEDIQVNQYNSVVKFRNGSRIVVVASNDGARGERSNVLVIDEFRLVDLRVLNDVLRKFLTAPRHCGFMDLPEYSDYPKEENKEIYLSSAWYASSWAHDLFRSYAANMAAGRSYVCCDFPYQLSIKEGLLTRSRVETEKLDSTFNEVSWLMEMEGIFWSGADGALYSYEDISPSRKLKYAFYPPQIAALISDKRIKTPPKLHNEIRVLSADIALMASSKKSDNDATSIFINQMHLKENGRSQKRLVYTENNEGLRTEEQALVIRRLFAEFDCDYLVIDGRGLGIGVLDCLMADMYDSETGVTYGALSCYNNPEIAARCKVKGAPKVIWAITATAEFNSQCALGLREEFRQGNLQLLCGEEDFEEVFGSLTGYSKLGVEDKLRLQSPYIHTSLLVNELINLEYESKNNVVRVKEKTGMRKDRYSSLSYNIYVAKQIEREYASSQKKKSFQDLVFQFRQPELGINN